MHVNNFNVLVATIVCFVVISVLTGEIRWGVLAGLVIGFSGLKWIRFKKREADDEVEYDERVNDNIKQFTLQSFAFSNLLLLVYLLISQLLLKQHVIPVNYLIIYLSLSFFISFFIGPSIVRKR